MKTNALRRAALSAKTASLRAAGAFTAAGLEVDAERGTIKGAAVMKIGPCEGHGFSVDATSLEQLRDVINATPGGQVMRFRHPVPNDDGSMPETLGTDVGFITNARVDGDTLRGDVQLMEYAKALPVYGDVWTYLLAKAKARPDSLGLSAVIHFEPVPVGEGGSGGVVARISGCSGVDFVGRGAATPDGLLSAAAPAPKQQVHTPPAGASPAPAAKPKTRTSLQTGASQMDPKKQYLIDNHGLSPDATDEQVAAAYDALAPEQRAACDAALSAAKASGGANLAAKAPAPSVAQLAGQTHEAMLAAEGKRVTMLRQLGETLNVDASVVQLAIAKGENVAEARVRFLAHLQEKCKPVENLAGASIRVGEDRNVASLSAALPHAIMLRSDAKVDKPHERAAQLRHLTLVDMGRHYFAALGAAGVWEMSRTKVAEMMLNPRALYRQFPNVAMLAQSTSDFASILADTIGKSLRQAYLDAPGTWQAWARRATAPDFKTISRTSLSESPNLVTRKEGGEVKYVTLSDGKETYTLSEYIGGIKLTRQAVINDDLDAFGRIPTLQANAAKRKEDDVAYAVLTDNATLSDSVALFHASHTNLGTGGAISVTTLGEGRKLMRTQKGPKGAAILNLRPKFLIVPAALESVAEQYTSSQFVAAQSSNINPFAQGNRSALVPVVEPRLDAASATAWYLAADNTQIDTVEVCFLLDEPEPVLKSESDWDTEDQKYAVRHTVAAKAIDYRGLVKNAGV